MNRIICLAAAMVVAATSGQAFASEFFVLPKSDSAGVYRNEIRQIFETPFFRVSAHDRLVVIGTRAGRYLVKDGYGRQGWMAKELCIRVTRGAGFNFDSAVVNTSWEPQGYIWIPGPAKITDEQILLDRSFAVELRCNSDKEELARITK